MHPPVPAAIHYPESDGKPMADNTIQFRWIQILSGNLAALFKDRADVFVGGNLFWYPVENFPNIVQAPDTFAVFGRPPGDRPSYKQWKEDDVPMTVVFEVRSPNDDDALMQRKLEFYDEYGVEEYYRFDPDTNRLFVYRQRGDSLVPVRLQSRSYISPRLGIRFDLSGPEMTVFYPNGEPFRTFQDLKAQQERDARRAEEAEREARQAQERITAAQNQATEAQERITEAQVRVTEAQERAAEAQVRATEAQERAAHTAERSKRMAELGRKARRGQATPEELVELERLEDEVA